MLQGHRPGYGKALGARLTHTLNLTFLYVTVSTLNPTVGMVVTDWLSLSLYRMATDYQLLGASSSDPFDPSEALFPWTTACA